MSKYSLVLTVPFLPMAFNQAKRTHFKKSNNINQDWYQIIYLYARGQLPSKPLTKAKLTLVRYHANKWLDYDGLCASFKAPVDGLVRAGILKDDGWLITGKWEVDQRRIKKAVAPYITVEVEEVTQGESNE